MKKMRLILSHEVTYVQVAIYLTHIFNYRVHRQTNTNIQTRKTLNLSASKINLSLCILWHYVLMKKTYIEAK